VVESHQRNPFWLSPIFTPDGHLLYLNQWPSFGAQIQVIDLQTHRMLGPVRLPTSVDAPPLFGVTAALAGGTASTVPISPDGLRLYAGTADGILVLRVPDLKPIAKLAPGQKIGEVWISGDGRTVYATADYPEKKLFVMRADGSGLKLVDLPGEPLGFVAL
jgi:hypothetical protein